MRRGEGGYVLLGVVIILVIMGIFMGSAVPVWQHMMQREREEELIWRGQQYIQAIELYQKKHPGAYPPKVEILVEQKFLRKAYTDPMAEDGEWKLLRQNSPEIRAMARPGGRRAPGTAQQPAGQQPGTQPAGQQPGTQPAGQQPGTQQPGTQQPGLRRDQQEQRRSSSRFSRSRGGLGAGGSELGLGGIVGVVSTSEDESIRTLDGKNKYNEWLFVALQETRGRRRPGAGRGRGMGRPGQGQQPGMGLPGQRQPGLQRPGRSQGLGQKGRRQGQQQQKNRPQ